MGSGVGVGDGVGSGLGVGLTSGAGATAIVAGLGLGRSTAATESPIPPRATTKATDAENAATSTSSAARIALVTGGRDNEGWRNAGRTTVYRRGASPATTAPRR